MKIINSKLSGWFIRSRYVRNKDFKITWEKLPLFGWNNRFYYQMSVFYKGELIDIRDEQSHLITSIVNVILDIKNHQYRRKIEEIDHEVNMKSQGYKLVYKTEEDKDGEEYFVGAKWVKQ